MKINFSTKKILPVFLFVILTILFIFFWQGIFYPLEEKEEKNVFEIKRGESSSEIAERLEKEEIIKNDLFFSVYVFLTGVRRNLQTGTYYLYSSENIPEIVDKITKGKTAQVQVTIPEGFSMDKIEKELIEKDLIEKTQLKDLKIEDFENQFDFFEDISSDKKLEGFLFPDTYIFSYNKKTEEIAEIMLKNFNQKVFLPFEEEVENHEKNIFEIIIMASLLEKEVRGMEDKKLVSDILWRRLEISMPLQVDATIAYLTGKRTTRIPLTDLEIDSLYNTYKYSGLPINPICNPGLESVLASVYPKDNDYWYYLSTSDGKTKFSKTLKQHNKYKNIYLK